MIPKIKIISSILKLALAFLLFTTQVNAQNTVLNNGRLRIGNGGENSINNSGNMQQPFYYNGTLAVWRKLTYSSYPLDIRWGAGGDGTNNWNTNGYMESNPVVFNIVYDNSGFTVTDIATGDGYGTIRFTGNIDIGGQLFLLENSYTLLQPEGYIETKVKITNQSGTDATNVRLWVGTRDDWVGNTDGPTKERGNLVNGAFQMISTPDEQAKAIKIKTDTEAILFYSSNNRTQTSINSCCSFTNATNQDPATSNITNTNDGSYTIFTRFNDLTDGSSDELTWYYAGGTLADIDDIITAVASASGHVSNISFTSADYSYTATLGGTTSYILVPAGSTVPTEVQIEAGVDYPGGTVISNSTAATIATVPYVFNFTGLTYYTNYTIYAITNYFDGSSFVYTAIQATNFTTLANDLPVGSAIATQTTCVNSTISALSLNITDAYPGDNTYTITASSSDTNIVLDENIIITGTGNSRSIAITPNVDASGTVIITISMTDSLGAIGTRTFIVKFGDFINPVAITQNISVILDTNGQAVVTPDMINNNSSDNCSIASYQLATQAPSSSKIYFTGTDGMIWSANRDGSGTPTVLYDYHDNNMHTAVGVEIDLDNSNVFFAGAYYRNIYSAPLDGLGIINTIPNTSASGNLHDFEIDREGNRLFYTNQSSGVFSTSIDGSASPTQIVAGNIVALTFDKTHQKIYFVNPYGTIGVVDADGSNANHNLFWANSPREITINEATGRLFWIEKNSKEIWTALVDGSEAPYVLYSFSVGDNFVQNAYGIDFDPNTNSLFWTAFGYSNEDTVYTASADGLGVPQILYRGNFGRIRGIAAGRNIRGVSLNPSTNSITYSAANMGSQTLYLIVTDAFGNVSYAPATITVSSTGNVGPEITCATNLSQNVDAGLCAASVTTQNLQITNIGDVSSLTWTMSGATSDSSPVSGINYVGTAVFNFGVTTITYTAKNALDNISICSFTVTVLDNDLPAATTQNITVYLDTNGEAILLPSQINNGSTDNCQIASYQLLTGTAISPKIYFSSTDGMIWSANRDGTGTPIALYDYHDVNMPTAVGIEANLNNGNFYFAGADNNNIYTSSLDGNGVINTIPNTYPNGYQHDLEIDWDLNKLFYTDSSDGVYVTSIDGSESATQIGTSGAVALTYDKTNQKIYYVNPSGSIGVVDADGSNENTYLFSAYNPRGITINEATGRLFWIEKNSKEVWTALGDGSEAPYVLYSFAGDNNFVHNAFGIDFDPHTNMLFWTAFGDSFDDTIYTAPADGSGVPQVLFVGNYGSIRGIAAGRNIHGESLTQYANSIPYTTSDIGVHTETLVVTDASGNVSFTQATVTVVAAPLSITSPGNIAASADSGTCSTSEVVGNPILSDLGNLSVLTWSMTGATTGSSPISGINYIGTAIFNSGVTTITYTATDNAVAVVECSFTVTVTDSEFPIVFTNNTTVILDSNGQATLIPSQIDDSSIDNCEIASYQLTEATNLSPFIYFTGVTDGKIWKANRNGSGTPVLLNASSPGATGIEVNYDNGKLYYATSTTNTIQTEALSGLGVSATVPNTNQGNNKHDFEYDWAGNRLFYSANNGGIYMASIDGLSAPVQLVSDAQVVALVFDKTNQKIYYGNLSGSIGVINADGSNQNNSLFLANSPKGITINEATGRLFWVEQSLKKIYTALIDGSEAPHQLYSTGATGNPFGIDYDATTDRLYWTVFNSGEKVVTAPASGVGAPVTLFNGSFGGLRGIAAGRNIKGVDLSTASNNLAFDCSNIGVNFIALIVTDNNGNASTKTATVTVVDSQNPTIATLDPISVGEDSGVCTYASSQLTAPTATDNCSVASVVVSPISLVLGENTVTWTATDASGNTQTSTQTVTVVDSQNPTIATLDPISVGEDSGVCTYASSQLTAPTATDNCSVASVVVSPISLVLGENTVTWTATDASGNTQTSTQTVTVADSQNPTITSLSITVLANASCSATEVDLGTPVTTDNCSVNTVTNDAPVIFPIGITTVIWTVTDLSGNTATANQMVTVNDDTLPIVITQNITVQLDVTGNVTIIVDQINNGSSDNCTISTMSLNQYTFTVSDVGIVTVTLTVTDNSGNTSSATAQVTVLAFLGTIDLKNNLFVIYPVPFDGSINITTPDSYTDDVIYIQIYELTGKIIYNHKRLVNNHNVFVDDLSRYSDGSYFVNLLDSNKKLIQSKHILKIAKH